MSENNPLAAPAGNLLCYGDNLDFLADRTMLPDASVDLIYLDPPFNSQQNYNVLFKESSGTAEAAQIKAFEDTWKWDDAANKALVQIHNDPAVASGLIDLMDTFMRFLRPSPMMAYLVQMAIRLAHMHRVLKPTGSLYLHCDPTASHYLKLVLDAIFGATNFRNEIVWQRTTSKGLMTRRLPQNHDIILSFQKSQESTWNLASTFVAYDQDDLDEKTATKYSLKDRDGRLYQLTDLSNPNPDRPNLTYEFLGITKVWRWTKERMQAAYDAGLVIQPRPGAVPRYKRYLDEQRGKPFGDVWTDIFPINSQAAERMGYPTQKPVALLKRIISASSNPGDTVLDPFCGCGTTIDAVETLNRESPGLPVRRWIGIDVTHLSINLIKHRLTRFAPLPTYEVVGEPASLGGAAALAKQDPYQFQFWVLGQVGARPLGGTKKKGADRGIDGVRYFIDEMQGNQSVNKRMIVQVKSGHVKAGDIRDLAGTLTREGAQIGLFITLEEPTAPMKSEAAAAGLYTSPWDRKAYPRLQIVTVADLLEDRYRPNPRCVALPGGVVGVNLTLPEAPRHETKTRQATLEFE